MKAVVSQITRADEQMLTLLGSFRQRVLSSHDNTLKCYINALDILTLFTVASKKTGKPLAAFDTLDHSHRSINWRTGMTSPANKTLTQCRVNVGSAS